MKNVLGFKRGEQPFLAPLGNNASRPSIRERLDNLPAAAAPIAVTLVGGLALVVLMGWFLSREAAVGPAGDEVAAAIAAPASTSEPIETAGGEAQSAPSPEVVPLSAEQAANEVTQSLRTASAPQQEPGLPDGLDKAASVVAQTPVAQDLPSTDFAPTAAIPPALPGASGFQPAVPVAETEAEIAALEAEQQEPAAEARQPAESTQIAAAPSGPMASATATKWVNMRSGPSDDAQILKVVPALAEIQAETGCNWCSVTYDGQQGYIYKTFISYADGGAEE